MKRKLFIAVVCIGLVARLFSACAHKHPPQQQQHQQEQTTTTEEASQQGPEYTSDYVCPMHCTGSGSDKPGTCPNCGMDYVARAELEKEEGHEH